MFQFKTQKNNTLLKLWTLLFLALAIPVSFNSCEGFVASNKDGFQDKASQLSTLPELQAQALSSTEAKLTWSLNSPGKYTFSIFRNDQYVDTITDLQFIDSTLNANTTYSYRVDAADIDTGEILATGIVNITTPEDGQTSDPNTEPAEPITEACPKKANTNENDLVYNSGNSSEFFINLDFEDDNQANLKGSPTESYCYSGQRALDSRSITGKAFSTGGSVRLPQGVGLGEEIRIRFRVFFPENYKFESCKSLGLPGCEVPETNNSIKFIGINFNVYNQGRHWFNIYHDNSSSDYFWVYEGNHSGFTKIQQDPIVKGRWETFEYYTKFSTTSQPSNVRVYKNGKLIHESSSNTINTTDMYMTSLYLLEYWNGGAPADQSVYFDEIIITNKTPKNTDEYGNPYLGY